MVSASRKFGTALLASLLLCSTVVAGGARADTNEADVTSTELSANGSGPLRTIIVVGTDALVGDITPDVLGEFLVGVRGPAGPMPNMLVTVDLSACPDVCVAHSDFSFPHPITGQSVYVHQNGATGVVTAHTGPNGEPAAFRIVGRGRNNNGCASGATGPTAILTWQGGPISGMSFPVSVADRDGQGVSGADFSLFAADYFCSGYHSRADFDGSGVVDGLDLSIFNAIYYGGGSIANSGTHYPWCMGN